MKITVTYGQDIPAYHTETIKVADDIAADENHLIEYLKARASELAESDDAIFETEWNSLNNLRIVCANEADTNEHEMLLEDIYVEDVLGPMYWEAGLLLDAFFRDGNRQTLVDAMVLLGHTAEDVEGLIAEAMLASAQQPQNKTIPPEVMAALDRMCIPLHESHLKGVTAREDAICMALIRDYILSKNYNQLTDSIADLAQEGLKTDGVHHKQYFLEKILEIADPALLERMRTDQTFDPGIPS